MIELLYVRRYQLPVIFIVMNNNGIYQGLDGESWNDVVSGDCLGTRYLIYSIGVV